MNFRAFSEMNLRRCVAQDGFNHPLLGWSPAEWTNAMCGEAGEAANFAKKLIRHRDGIAGNHKPGDLEVNALRLATAKECVDAMLYADLTIRSLGYISADMISIVFNAKSRELNMPYIFTEL